MMMILAVYYYVRTLVEPSAPPSGSNHTKAISTQAAVTSYKVVIG